MKSLTEIRDEIIKFAKKRGEKINFIDKKCIDTFTLNYMVMVIDYFINKKK